MQDIPLILLSILAGASTFFVLAVHSAWLVISFSLRKHGRRVTGLHHDWTKVQKIIESVDSPEARSRYQKWLVLLRYTYVAWGMAMAVLALVAIFVYN